MSATAIADLETAARAALSTGDWPAAVGAFEGVARLSPGDPRPLANLARARLKAGLNPAMPARRAVLLAPAAAGAIEILVTSMGAEMADPRWSWLACADPARPLAAKVMGGRLQKAGRASVARELFARALALDPSDEDARVNLAMSEIELGELATAESRLDAVLSRDPSEPRARYAKGWMRLARRDWSGYGDYDARWRAPETDGRTGGRTDCRTRAVPAPLWDGRPIAGGNLVLSGQFGVGDEILFAGLVPAAAACAGTGTVLEADSRLVPLFARSFPEVTVVARTDPPDAAVAGGAAAQCATPRLPVLIGPGTPAFEPLKPFLVPDPARVSDWRDRLATLGPGPYTGLIWRSGNRRTGGRKSIALERLDPLLRALGGTVVSLQYDPDPEEIAEVRAAGHPVPVDNPADDLRNGLDDLAAQIAAYDRVVTISGVVAHLAGGLGVTGLVLMQRDPLWFWFREGETVPWYPSLTLIRQRGAGWDAVVAEAVDRAKRF